MGLVVAKIEDNEHFEYKGDVEVGAIGTNATVIIKNGSINVAGDVGSGSDITLTSSGNSSVVVSTGTFFNVGSSIVVGGSGACSIHVKGSLKNNVTIKSQSADILVDGVVGSQVRIQTQSGDVNVGAIENNSMIKTMSGDIRAGNVGLGTSLNTMSGDINAANVGSNSSLKTMSGDINVHQADASASLESMSGDIREGGVKRRKEQPTFSGISIGGLSFIGGVGRVFMNGRDITNLVHGAAATESNQEEAPVRYSKR